MTMTMMTPAEVSEARREAVRYCRSFPVDELLERLPLTDAPDEVYALAMRLASELSAIDSPDEDSGLFEGVAS
jgi:hypothetical protein